MASEYTLGIFVSLLQDDMKKFMALYMAPISSLEQMSNATPEQMKSGMDAWKKWSDAHKEGIKEIGTPLGKTKTVTPQGITDTKNEVCGYTMVEADSHDAAAALFTDHPHLTMQGATIDVLECVSMS
jgi:hypothetical protein